MLAAAGARARRRAARAGSFPNRTIRIVVPVAPGGGVDTFARLIANKVKQLARHQLHRREPHRRQQHDRRPRGAARRAGRRHRAVPRLDPQRRAAGAEEPAVRSGHRFHPDRARRRGAAGAILANNRPEKTLAEIVAAAKKEPDAWTFATAQLGAPGHLAEVAFNQYAGTNVPIIPYRGTAPAANDVAGGHVPMMIEAILALLPMVQRRQRARRSRSPARSAARSRRKSRPWPRSACRQLNFGAWWGMWGPPGLPAELTATHQRPGQRGGEVAGRRRPARRARHRARRRDARRRSPRFIEADYERSAKLLKAANFQPE